jgi:predicted secreted acid phosphatase
LVYDTRYEQSQKINVQKHQRSHDYAIESAKDEVTAMICVVVDIDDTLVRTQRRVWNAWRIVLGHEIPMRELESLGSHRILEKYGSSNPELWKRFWSIMLCVEDVGGELLKLDEPMPFAAEVLQRWVKRSALVYITGRPETMRNLTLEELGNLGFPTDGADLAMFSLKDWENFSSITSLLDARSRVFSSIRKQYNVVEVVDDDPRFFAIYQRADVPERIGLLRRNRFSPEDYFSQGATRVIGSWKQLQGDASGPV